jgi:phosphoadenosine phosphosulfate reductase
VRCNHIAHCSVASLAQVAREIPAFVDEHDAGDVLAWAESAFGSGLVLTCSFETAVLPHLVSRFASSASVVLIDTQYLFPETIEFARRVCAQLEIELQIEQPAREVVPDELWRSDIDGCCDVRKVQPLRRVLENKSAWITGLRRSDGFERTVAPIAAYDLIRGVMKINPLAAWSDADVQQYLADHELPRNPLTERGYSSIGCWPCTRPTEPGENRRDGRWPGQDKTECGLHKI